MIAEENRRSRQNGNNKFNKTQDNQIANMRLLQEPPNFNTNQNTFDQGQNRDASQSPGRNEMQMNAKSISNKNKEVSVFLGGYG